MTSAKRGKNVWACGICGYWSPRKKNVERHNTSIHTGSAIVVPAYATLVVEPSYKITPLGFPRAPMVAHDTTTTTSMFTGSPTTAAGAAKKEPFNLAKAITSSLEEEVKPILVMRKTIKEVLHLAGETEGYGTFAPIAQPYAYPQQYPTFETAGYMGMICNKCFTTVLMQIPKSPRPEDFRPAVESLHSCKGERTFPSETARQEKIQQVQASMEDSLFTKVKEWLKDKEIVQFTERLDDYVPQSSTPIFEYTSESMTFDSPTQTGPITKTTQIDDAGLKRFLTDTHSTIAIIKVTDATKASYYYRFSVQGRPRDEQRTAPPAGTSVNVGGAVAASTTNTAEKEKERTTDKGQQYVTATATPFQETERKEPANGPVLKDAPDKGAE